MLMKLILCLVRILNLKIFEEMSYLPSFRYRDAFLYFQYNCDKGEEGLGSKA